MQSIIKVDLDQLVGYSLVPLFEIFINIEIVAFLGFFKLILRFFQLYIFGLAFFDSSRLVRNDDVLALKVVPRLTLKLEGFGTTVRFAFILITD